VTVTTDVIAREGQACRATLQALGPDAATLCGDWTTADLAAHLTTAGFLGGVPTFLGRRLVAAGIRLNDRAANRAAAAGLGRRYKRKGFEWALERIGGTPPRLHTRPAVAAVTLFEIWTHHEDVRRANGMGPDPGREYPELADCLAFVARYHRGHLGAATWVVEPAGDGEAWRWGSGAAEIVVSGPMGEALLWAAGRHRVAQVGVEAPDALMSTLRARLFV
jgi:uncharacterized protein (TIGR03085 family)